MEAEILYEWSTIGTTAKSGDEGMGGGGIICFLGKTEATYWNIDDGKIKLIVFV